MARPQSRTLLPIFFGVLSLFLTFLHFNLWMRLLGRVIVVLNWLNFDSASLHYWLRCGIWATTVFFVGSSILSFCCLSRRADAIGRTMIVLSTLAMLVSFFPLMSPFGFLAGLLGVFAGSITRNNAC